MLILPKINLSLNFKPEQKNYKFVVDVPTDASEAVTRYLMEMYPGKFIVIIPPKAVVVTPVEPGQDSDNLLFKLIEIENRNTPKVFTDIKQIIEKAIEQKIITKSGSTYNVEGTPCKGISKVKAHLEGNENILQQIAVKIK